MTLIPFLYLSVVHGGYDDAAGISLWIDTDRDIAYLCGHSGSMIPMDGPSPKNDMPYWEATGKKGHIAIFDAETRDAITRDLEPLVAAYIDGSRPAEEISREIQDRLDAVDLAQQSYQSWLAENDPETCYDLYGNSHITEDALS